MLVRTFHIRGRGYPVIGPRATLPSRCGRGHLSKELHRGNHRLDRPGPHRRSHRQGDHAIIGIIGAILGGFLASALLDINVNDGFFNIGTWISAIVGSLILLFIYRLVTGRKSRSRA